MKELVIEKASKLKFSLDVFISIVVFVFALGVAWSSINAKQTMMISTQKQMMSKIDDLSVVQKELVVTRDVQHSLIDKQLGYLIPTVEMLIKKMGL